MLKAREWRKCCFYVKHINYKKTLVTAPLVKLNLSLRINNIYSFSRCLRSKVWVILPVRVKKLGVKRLKWNKDDIWPEIICLCIRKTKWWLDFYQKVTGLCTPSFIYLFLCLFSQVFLKIQIQNFWKGIENLVIILSLTKRNFLIEKVI